LCESLIVVLTHYSVTVNFFPNNKTCSRNSELLNRSSRVAYLLVAAASMDERARLYNIYIYSVSRQGLSVSITWWPPGNNYRFTPGIFRAAVSLILQLEKCPV